MTLEKKLELEPLSDQRWARVERELFDRVANGELESGSGRAPPITARRWRMKAALGLVAALSVTIGGVAAWRAFGSARASAITASAPSRMTTEGAGSHVVVGESSIDLAPESTVLVTGDDARGMTVLLEHGRVELEVPPRLGRPPVAVEAGAVRVTVVGTHFAVTRNADGVLVEVQRGHVEVSEGTNRVDVRAGERWPASAPLPASRPSAQAPSEPSQNAPAIAASRAATASSVVARTPSASATATLRDRYDAASRLEATRPDEAIAIYRDLAAGGGPWGMNALFAQARLELDRGRRDEARGLLRDYLARYPSGPNANDARQLLERTP